MNKQRYILSLIITIALTFVASGKMAAQVITYGGDINNDGKYTITDMARLIDVLNGDNTYATNAADVNGDGSVNLEDVAKLQELIFKDVLPGSVGRARRRGGSYTEWVQLWADGPKWAVYNIGAEAKNEYGGYYKWGSTTEGKNGTSSNSTIGIQATEYDTAYKLWGAYWQMPAKTDFDALKEYCTYKKTSTYFGDDSQITGFVVKGKGKYSNNEIFLPAAGNMYGDNLKTYGYYWTCSTNGSSPYSFGISNYGYSTNTGGADIGISVRAIAREIPDGTIIAHPDEEANEEVGAGAKKR